MFDASLNGTYSMVNWPYATRLDASASKTKRLVQRIAVWAKDESVTTRRINVLARRLQRLGAHV